MVGFGVDLEWVLGDGDSFWRDCERVEWPGVAFRGLDDKLVWTMSNDTEQLMVNCKKDDCFCS